MIAKTCLCCNRTSRSAGRNVGRKYGRDYGRHRGLIESRNASRDESRDVGHNVGLSLLVTGFREWPKGVERAEDADSGPVVSGIGAAASAFGISAARAMGDERLAQRLESVADRVTWLGGKVSTSIERAAASTLAAAIRASARQQRALVR